MDCNKRPLVIPHELRNWQGEHNKDSLTVTENHYIIIIKTDENRSMEGFPVLEPTQSAAELVDILISNGALPNAAHDDATHVAIATVHQMDYLVTWNCRHIDNAETKPLMRSVCAVHGYSCPEICTPEELMGGVPHEG